MEGKTAIRAEVDEGELAEGDDLETEMALLALLTARDVGDPTETAPVDLHALSATEKQVLLQMMRDRIGFVEPPRLENIADVPAVWEASAS